MAYIKAIETSQKRSGKPVKRYAVIRREPVRDKFGLPVPENPDHPDGPKRMRNRSERYPTRKAAQARVDELNAAKHTTGMSALADAKKAGELPFGYYARGWLDQQAVKVSQEKLKARTADEYGRLLRSYVLGYLGPLAVAMVAPAHIEQLLAALVRQTSRQGNRKPLTPGTVKHIWDVTRRVFKYALQHKAILANPCDAVDFSASRATGGNSGFEHHPLTAEEVGRLSAAIAGTPPDGYDGPALPAYSTYALMVEFMAYTGLRAGEVAGLEVGDLAFAPGLKGAVKVQRTKDRKKGQWVAGTPKSKKSRRTVPLPGWLAEKMANYLAEHPRAGDPTAPLGRRGKTAAVTARRGSDTGYRSTGRSRWRWARSTKQFSGPPWRRWAYRRADPPRR
jgi:integrase